MGQKLVTNLLLNLEKFQQEVTEILKRTPKNGGAKHIEFWIYFFLGVVITDNNDQLKITDTCFYVKNNILKLAFKTQDNEIIIRYIEISTQPLPKTSDTKINIKGTDLSEIKTVLNGIDKNNEFKYIKLYKGAHDNRLTNEIIKVYDIEFTEQSLTKSDKSSSSSSKSTSTDIQFKKVQYPEYKDEGGNSKPNFNTVNSVMSAIKSSQKTYEDVDVNKFKEHIKTLILKVKDMYTTNQLQQIYQNPHHKYKSLKSKYQGFIYGTLENYKNQYNVDAYFEYSAGRGFLDICFLLRTNNKAIPVVIKVKANQSMLSVENGMDQILSQGYTKQLLLRTLSKKVVIVSTNFGFPMGSTNVGSVKNEQKDKDFVQSLIDIVSNDNMSSVQQEKEITQGIREIYLATRKDEETQLVILGGLLSSQHAHDVRVYTFTNKQNKIAFGFDISEHSSIVLGIITRKGNDQSSDSTTEQERNSENLYISSKLRSNIQEVIITINPDGSFGANNNHPLFVESVKIAPYNVPPAQRISEKPTYIKHEVKLEHIDINKLVPELQRVASGNIQSLQHDTSIVKYPQEQPVERNKVTDIIKLQRTILSTEVIWVDYKKGFKAVLHGLFLHKNKNMNIIPKVSANHGRADLVLCIDNNTNRDIVVFELGIGKSREIVQEKITQSQRYIRGMKSVTAASNAYGVALVVVKQAGIASEAILVGGVKADTTHNSPDENFPSSSSSKNSPLGRIRNVLTDNNSGSLSGQKRKSSLDDSTEVKRIATDCLPSTSRNKRKVTNKCKISWKDIDKFNLEPHDKRNHRKIKIDSAKFVHYIQNTKDGTKELQLLAFVKYVRSINADNIIGNDKDLVFKIIESNGYKNYIDVMNRLIQECANTPNTKMSPQLRSKLMSAVSTIQLEYTTQLVTDIYNKNNATIQCCDSTVGFEYSRTLEFVQNKLLKNMPNL